MPIAVVGDLRYDKMCVYLDHGLSMKDNSQT